MADRPGDASRWGWYGLIAGKEGNGESGYASPVGRGRVAGRSPINLRFVEWQYRQPGRAPSYAAIDRALTREVAAVSSVYAPATLGHAHPDHLLVRSYALRLLRAGIPIRLYADLPYCARDGWPSWVSGLAASDPAVEARWDEALTLIGARASPDAAEVTRLAPAEAAAKLEALQRYETQFRALDRAFPGVLSDPGVYGCEVSWRLMPAS